MLFGPRRLITLLAALALLALGLGAGVARAEYGGLGSVGSLAPGAEETPEAFAVDPGSGNFYIAGRFKSEGKLLFRIRRFSSTGTPEGAVAEVKPEAGEDKIGGLAVDPENGKVYLLLLETRTGTRDKGAEAAAALYAYNSVLEEGTLLAGPEALEPQDEAGERDVAALLGVHGIAVEAVTGHVLVSGQEDVAGKGEASTLRAAIQRIRAPEAAEKRIGARYVAGEAAPHVLSSPVVPASERLLAQGEGSIWEAPVAAEAGDAFATTSVAAEEAHSITPVVRYSPPAEGAISLASPQSEAGDQLEFVGGSGHGRVYAAASLLGGGPALLLLEYTEANSEAPLTELGWTGGQPEFGAPNPQCVVPQPETSLLAGGFSGSGKEEGLLFSSETGAIKVMGFGPGGELCGHASLEPPIVLNAREVPTTTVAAAERATLTDTFSPLGGIADVLSGEWIVKNKATQAEETLPFGLQGQFLPAVAHTFAKGGEYEVIARATLDDFQPVQEAQTTIDVMEVKFSSAAAVTSGTPLRFVAHVIDPGEASPPEYRYTWRFGDGTTATGTSTSAEFAIEHPYALPGTYRPLLEVFDRGKHGAAARNEITVTAAPPAPPGISPSKPVTPIPTPSFAQIQLLTKSVTVKHPGTLPLKLRCVSSGGPCSGEIVLKTTTKVRVSKRKHAKKRTLTIARVAFSLPAGATRTITLRITGRGRALLTSKHALKLAASVTSRQPSGESQTAHEALVVRLAHKKKH